MSAKSQVNTYLFSQSTGAYSEITDGTVLGTSTNDDNRFEAQAIGFTFNFIGTDFSTVSINTNGFVQLGNTVIQTSNNAISSSSTQNVIASLSRDLKGKSTGSELMIKTEGEAPNRVFIVQWKNYKFYGAADADCNLNFQIKLYETSNKIEFIYGTFLQTSLEKLCEVGIKGTSNADYSNRTTTNNWNETTTGTTISATCTVNSTVKPSSGLTFTWNKPTNEPPSQAVLVSPANNAIDQFPGILLDWESGGGLVNGYKLYFGSDNPPTQMTDVGMNTYFEPALSYGTTFYWMVKPYNYNGTQENVPVWSFTTVSEISLPYSQNFDNTGNAPLPIGWTKILYHSTNPSGVDVYVTPYDPFSSPNSVMLKNSSQPSTDTRIYLVSPPTNTDVNLTRVRFYAKALSSSTASLKVGTISGNVDANSFVNSQTISLTSEYQLYTIDFSSYSGTSKCIAFKLASTQNPNDLIFIDDIYWETIPSTGQIEVTPNPFDFGNVKIFTTSVNNSFRIKNVGVQSLTINSANDISIFGTNASNFNIYIPQNVTFPVILNVDDYIDVEISFTPTSIGQNSAQLTVQAQGLDLYQANLQGTGVANTTITAYPYLQNFDSDNGNYESFAIEGTNQWEWGQPNKATYMQSAHSGSKAWVTKLTPELQNGYNPLYDHNTNSYLLSPIFDFSTLSNPMLSVWLFIRTDKNIQNEIGFDAMILESSTDNGKTWQKVVGDNGFYNYTGSNGTNLTSPKWAAQNTNWQIFETHLSGLANQSKVLLRFRFVSDDNGFREEGIAIDDINIFQNNVGISQIENKNNIFIYPNPASNYVFINSYDQIQRITIFDINGKRIEQFSMDSNKSIDISEIPNGFYFLEISTDKDISKHKIIIKR